MTTTPPLACRWDGESFTPLPRLARVADEHFVIGEVYHLVDEQDRSSKSHRHYFAMLKEAFDNLPETETRFPSVESLRKYALIKAGYYDAAVHPCVFKTEAVRLEAALRPRDDFAIITRIGKVVTVYTAKSQRMRAMGRKVFQESKDAVLQIVSEMISVEPAVLEERARLAA